MKVWKCNHCGCYNLFEWTKYCHKCKSPKIWVEPEAKTGAQKTYVQIGTTIDAQKANIQTGTKIGAQKANVQTGTKIGPQKTNVQTEAEADTQKAKEMNGQPTSKLTLLCNMYFVAKHSTVYLQLYKSHLNLNYLLVLFPLGFDIYLNNSIY